MAFYEHICTDENCKHEWSDEYSVHQDPPKICPKCGKETAKRLISSGPRGRVELTGQDLVDSVKSDAKRIQKEASKNENLYSNLIGPDHYQNLQTRMDRQKRNR